MDRQLVLLGQLNQILASVQDQASADAAREDYAEVMRQLEDQPDLSALSDAQSESLRTQFGERMEALQSETMKHYLRISTTIPGGTEFLSSPKPNPN
ncbi:MAG: hypothetical protein R3F17_13535 [Planctomycetota bacterium]